MDKRPLVTPEELFETPYRATSVRDLRQALEKLDDSWYLALARNNNLAVLSDIGQYIGYYEMRGGHGSLTLFDIKII